MLPVLMMRPHPAANMCGSAAFVVWNADDRQTAMTASHLSSGNDSTGATCWMPALLQRICSPPRRSATPATIDRIAAGLVRSASL